MKKYKHLWTFQDQDGLWLIVGTPAAGGHADIIPKCFGTQEAAQRYIDAMQGR